MLSSTPWQPDYPGIYQLRSDTLLRLRKQPDLRGGMRKFYRDNPAKYISDWVDTYDPRNSGSGKPVRMPLALFKRQTELVEFLVALTRAQTGGLIEKSRDMGATWVACGFSVWAWNFLDGPAVGWGSRKEPLVDKLGDPDSIFEKMRMIIRGTPPELLPRGFDPDKHMNHMRIVNPATDATITGEVGDNIGRGGRKWLYFKDESAHYEHPEMIEASLMDNTNVQVDISSVNGLGNVFHRRREAGTDWTPGMEMKRGTTYVFVMDWRDHPLKTQEWYDTRRAKAVDEGLLHKFAQEVDRDYAASVQGIIIEAKWVQAAIDADKVLGLDDSGGWAAALDVADEGLDKNALATRKGIFVKSVDEWGDRDVGVATRRAMAACKPLLAPRTSVDLQYDCVGMGSTVKAEYNRLKDDGAVPTGLRLVPWNAADEVKDKDMNLIAGDPSSPLNGDLFHNLKAQGWWHLARRFERTWRAVEKIKGNPEQADFTYDKADLIVLPSTLPLLRKLQKELSQAVFTQSATLKLLVDKTPEGTSSPNMADAVMMMFWPAGAGSVTVNAAVLNRARTLAPRRPVRRF